MMVAAEVETRDDGDGGIRDTSWMQYNKNGGGRDAELWIWHKIMIEVYTHVYE